MSRTVVVGHVPVAGELVRERPHVAGALHVVLPAQRVHADALAADVAGDHGQVGHAHHHRRALAVLGDAEAVVDRARSAPVRRGGRRPARSAAGTPVSCSHRLGQLLGSRDELEVLVGVLAARRDELLVDKPLGDDDVRHRVDEGDVGARAAAGGGKAASTCGERTRSIRRGSATISWAPSRSRRFIREANTGWASVGLAPITRMTSACVDRPEVLGAGRGRRRSA